MVVRHLLPSNYLPVIGHWLGILVGVAVVEGAVGSGAVIWLECTPISPPPLPPRVPARLCPTQDSLGGTARTILILNCSLERRHARETRSTLEFGVRARGVKNHVKRHVEVRVTVGEWVVRVNEG